MKKTIALMLIITLILTVSFSSLAYEKGNLVTVPPLRNMVSVDAYKNKLLVEYISNNLYVSGACLGLPFLFANNSTLRIIALTGAGLVAGLGLVLQLSASIINDESNNKFFIAEKNGATDQELENIAYEKYKKLSDTYELGLKTEGALLTAYGVGLLVNADNAGKAYSNADVYSEFQRLGAYGIILLGVYTAFIEKPMVTTMLEDYEKANNLSVNITPVSDGLSMELAYKF
ncbi:hypothetical protein ACFL4D_01255 [Candidatus Margulisiibacteriota bacterium]